MLTDIEKVRLEVGLTHDFADLITDDEINYYLEQNNNNIRRASIACAKTVLFILTQIVHNKADGLEIWGTDHFNNYYKALNLYLSNPDLNGVTLLATPYCGGISNSDIRKNLDNSDVNAVIVDKGIPTDNVIKLNNNSIFDSNDYFDY